MGYICSCHALSFVRSLQCLRSSFTVRSGSAIPEPCCFLDSDRRTLAAHCFPALPASALRKAPHLPMESSVSAYGSSASALRKAPLLPTEAPPLPYGKLRLVSRCVLLPVINSLSATESSRLHCDTDGLAGRVLRVCTEQLADVFTHIFKLYLVQPVVLTYYKTATIVPVPKHYNFALRK